MAADERWYFTREQLANTPSRRCGIDADKELSYRQQAANFIQDMGQRLVVYPFIVRNTRMLRRSVAFFTLLDRRPLLPFLPFSFCLLIFSLYRAFATADECQNIRENPFFKTRTITMSINASLIPPCTIGLRAGNGGFTILESHISQVP